MSSCNTYTGWNKGQGTNYILNKIADDILSGLKDCFAYIFNQPSTALVIYMSLSVVYPPVSLCP